VCAEDPVTGFLPSTGTILDFREPALPGVRVDKGVRPLCRVTTHYDSLLAKVIATGADREAALERLDHALDELRLLGLPTNAGYLRRLLAVPAVRAGELDTGLIERGEASPQPSEEERREALVAAAAIETLALREGAAGDPWDALVGFRLEGPAPLAWELQPLGAEEPVVVTVDGARAALDGRVSAVHAIAVDPATAAVTQDGRTRHWRHAVDGAERWVAAGPDAFAFRLVEPVVEDAAAAAEGSLEAPMPGTVLEVRVTAGDAVAEGEVLVVMESMKMEMTLIAPADATVAEVHVAQGDGVRQGQPLVELEVAA
jgi:acetyl-CoA/propionyl-CoA carboxylase biotin carboxyl carrier protein